MDLIDKNIMEQQKAEIDSYCAKEKCKHFYTSAKTGFQLDEVFETLINSVLNKVNSSTEGAVGKRRGKKLEISEQKVKKEKKGCC